jgi:transposase InsO family protein
MKQKSVHRGSPPEQIVKNMRRATRKRHSSEEKIRIVLDGLRGESIAWKLCTTMKAQDVADTLDLALAASGCDQMRIVHKPRLLSDNGSSYVSAELADWLDAQNMGHVRGAPYHPQTQGKIERWHQTLKNRILLENYYMPGAS